MQRQSCPSSQKFSDDLPNLAHMFATKMNELHLYISPVPADPNAVAVDALNISSEVLDSYIYCPIALNPKLIQKTENL